MIAGLEELQKGVIHDDILVNDVPPKDRNIAMVSNHTPYIHI